MLGGTGGVSGGEQFLDKDNPLRWWVGRGGGFSSTSPLATIRSPLSTAACAPRNRPPSTTDSTPLLVVSKEQATGAPFDASPPPRRSTHIPPTRLRLHHLPGPYHTRARTDAPHTHTHHARTYRALTHTHKTQDSAAVAAASERSSRGGRRVPPVDGEPLWSMAAPCSGGGGRRSDDVSTAALPLAAAAAPKTATTTTTNTTPSKMPPLQRLAGGPRLADTQVAAADKSHRRKISLPWFRQTSTSTAAAALARQHTIDTPGSYRHRSSTAARSSAASVQVYHSNAWPTSTCVCVDRRWFFPFVWILW